MSYSHRVKCEYILSEHDVAKVKKIQGFHRVPDTDANFLLTNVSDYSLANASIR
ncbi:hypothetical protein HORM4_1120155 [Vibrio harveyi]|nr:hypothetical protein VHARVF571_580016 [Vibrio harveyi]CAK6712396.1 hypothetical protein HORM4_1120155 [Vibrio harveyi]